MNTPGLRWLGLAVVALGALASCSNTAPAAVRYSPGPERELQLAVPLCDGARLEAIWLEADDRVVWSLDAVDDGRALHTVSVGDVPDGYVAEGADSSTELEALGATTFVVQAVADGSPYLAFELAEVPTDGTWLFDATPAEVRSTEELDDSFRHFCHPWDAERVLLLIGLGLGAAAVVGGIIYGDHRWGRRPASTTPPPGGPVRTRPRGRRR